MESVPTLDNCTMVLETSAGKGLRFNSKWGGSETTLATEHSIPNLLTFNGLIEKVPFAGAERETGGLSNWVVGQIRIEDGKR